ncbi:MAG: dicarboxylate/amino acid:cation symporter [Tissierellia bacterium]|nr:dicarboxylate/amino acid:cation symporter [Tissierellia bacterium]
MDKKIKKNRKDLNLTKLIFIGLISGAILGIILNTLGPSHWRDDIVIDGVFHILGTGFIRAMQMLVVPLVFASLVSGSMSMGDTKKLGSIGIRTVLFYLLTTALAIAIAITLAVLIKPGLGMDLSVADSQSFDAAAIENADVSMVETLLNIIPTNPVGGMAEGNMLQIIFFAIVLGLVLANMGSNASYLANLFTEFNDAMMKMTMGVMKFAPIGVFALVAKTFSQLGFDAILSMLTYMGTVILALIVQLFIVYMILLAVLGRVNPLKFIRKMLPVMSFAFSTASSSATVPLSIKNLEDMGVDKRISSFTIPLGATVNMDGTAIMQGVAVIFVAHAYGISLGFNDYLTVIIAATLASVGTAGIPSVGLITLSMVFNSVGLPVEGIAMIMGIDRLLDMARTAVNVTGDATCTVILSRQSKMINMERFNE